MRGKAPSFAVAALVTATIAGNAYAGIVDPELQAAIARLGPNERVAVIIRCADPVRPGDFAQGDRRTKRARLVAALRARATRCQDLLARDLAAADGEDRTNLWLINSVAARVRAGRVQRLAQRAGVEAVFLNKEVSLPQDPPSAIPAGEPGNPGFTFWNLSEIRVPDLWALGYYGQGVVVATLDTGVDAGHLDIGPNWRGGGNSWFDPNGEHSAPYDANGHGTQVMGILLGGNSLGVDIGAAPGAQWIAAKIFNDAGVSDLAKIHASYQWLLDPDGDPSSDDAPDIVNNSWALPDPGACTGEFAADIALLKAADIAVVSAAGNFGPSSGTSVEPANNPGSLSVGAVDYYRDLVYSSSHGPSACDNGVFPSLVAPGKDIFTTGLTSGGANPGAWAYGSGTSMSAPHVAGAMAILRSALHDATPAELEAAIRSGALDLGASGPDNATGSGYLDLVSAFYALADGAPADLDSDGVTDGQDLCPATPAGEAVDNSGCSASQRDSDSDGVSDVLDLCPQTPPGETPNAAGCAPSQLDSDGDGVSDALDLCPNTPPGTPVDAEGCLLGPADADGDGFAADVDCDDFSASVYPGAPETNGDGIDQDCNGLDLTIAIGLARYVASKDQLVVQATSDRAAQAGLRATITLQNGNAIDRPLVWKPALGRWQQTFSTFVTIYGSVPVSVRVHGAEGSVSAPVQRR